MTRHVLVCRLDNAGDVPLTGPAVRAVRAEAERLTAITRRSALALVDELAGRAIDQAFAVTPAHPSPLPLALVRRTARVPTLGYRLWLGAHT